MEETPKGAGPWRLQEDTKANAADTAAQVRAESSPLDLSTVTGALTRARERLHGGGSWATGGWSISGVPPPRGCSTCNNLLDLPELLFFNLEIFWGCYN